MNRFAFRILSDRAVRGFVPAGVSARGTTGTKTTTTT